MEIDRKNKIASLDHRRFPRKILDRHLLGLLVVGGKTYPTKVIDYSPRGVSLELDGNMLEKAEEQNFEIELRFDHTSFAGTIRHSHKDDDNKVFAGVAIKNLDPKKEVSFTDVDPGWDLVEDQETLQNLFNDLAFKGPEVLCKLRQIQGQAEVFAKEVRDGELVLEVFELSRGKLIEGFCSLRFEMFQTCHSLDSRIVKVDGNDIVVAIPQKIARLLRRETVRIANGTNDHVITAEIESSVLGKSTTVLRVADYSEHGISIFDPDLWLHVPPGVPIEKVVLTTNKGKTITGKGVIRGHSWLSEHGSHAAGIYFETATPEDRTNWHNFILEARYPALSFEYSNSDHEKIWNLFSRSKYISLAGDSDFTDVYEVTKKTWKMLSDAGTKISKRVLIKYENDVVGHLQMDRIFTNTWCAHHLAIDPKISKLVGKEIYSVTADVLSSEGANYIWSLTDSNKPWNQRSYYDFVGQYRYPEHNELKNFQVFEVDLKKPVSLNSDPSIKVSLADDYDMGRILKYFEIKTSQLEKDACSLHSNDINLTSLRKELEPYGLYRSRDFLAAKLGSTLLGFAQIERGTFGVNVYGLLDHMYIYLMDDGSKKSEIVHETLLNESLRYYRKFETNNVMLVLDINSERVEYYSSKGLQFIWKGVRWIAASVTSRRFHAYSQGLYGRLLLRKSKIKDKRKKVV